jgi:predicted amidohydrolase
MEENLKQCRYVIDKAVAEGAKVRHSDLNILTRCRSLQV